MSNNEAPRWCEFSADGSAFRQCEDCQLCFLIAEKKPQGVEDPEA